MAQERRLRWGIMATGRIAATFARGLRGSRTGVLTAVGSRSAEAADRFAVEHGGVRAHASYEALLTDPEVEAVYLATPHPQHARWAERVFAAGKHLLVEKPIGMTRAEAEHVIAAARRSGRTLMEAWMYRCHPQTARVVELIRDGALGEVRGFQGTFSYDKPFAAEDRAWNNELGGGGILDVGGYPVSWARLVAGVASGRPFLDPVELVGLGQLHPQTRVDAHTAAILKFETGLVAQVACGVGLAQENAVRIYGSRGWLLVPDPHVVGREGQSSRLTLHRHGDAEEIVITPDRGLYAYEADAFGTAVMAGAVEVPACTWADTLGNMAALDAWRRQIGLTYAADGAA